MEVRLDRLLGRKVTARNGRTVGRLEEFRADRRGDSWVITGYVLGETGLLERLHVGAKLLYSSKRGGYLAKWDQIDISDPEHPRLLCSPDELKRVR